MNNFVTSSLAPEQRRAGHLSQVRAEAKARFAFALTFSMKSEMRQRPGWNAESAADVLIDSATDTYERQEMLARLLVDGANGQDISTRCKLILSTALEQFAQGEVTREEADLEN